MFIYIPWNFHSATGDDATDLMNSEKRRTIIGICSLLVCVAFSCLLQQSGTEGFRLWLCATIGNVQQIQSWNETLALIKHFSLTLWDDSLLKLIVQLPFIILVAPYLDSLLPNKDQSYLKRSLFSW